MTGEKKVPRTTRDLIPDDYWGSLVHLRRGFVAPVMSGIFFGLALTARDASQARYTMSRTVSYAAGAYAYRAMQCPMEAIQGGQSKVHDFIAAGIVGYVGVTSGRYRVPWLYETVLHKRFPLGISTFWIYGLLGTTLALLAEKGKTKTLKRSDDDGVGQQGK